jgi:hypothetical protein
LAETVVATSPALAMTQLQQITAAATQCVVEDGFMVKLLEEEKKGWLESSVLCCPRQKS